METRNELTDTPAEENSTTAPVSLQPKIWRRELAIVGLFALIAVVFTWPMVLHFRESVPGEDHKDVWMMVWNLWWVRHAFETGQNPFQTDLLFYPMQPGLVLHTLHFWNGVVSLPIQYIFGGAAHGAVAAYNFCVLLSFTLGAYGSYRLASWLWGDWRAALIAGLAYGFSTYHFSHLLGHLNLLSSEFIPFYLLFFLKTLTERAHWKRNAALSVMFLIFTMLLDLQYVLYLAIVCFFILLYITGKLLWRKHGRELLPLLGRAAAIVGVFAVVTLPFTIPLAKEITDPNIVPKREENIYSADLLAYFYPSPFHPLWGDSLSRAIKPWTATLIEKLVFPGYTIYLLILIGLGLGLRSRIKREPKKTTATPNNRPLLPGVGFWLVVAGIFAVLSFGRRLHINGVEHGPSLPASVIFDLPILNVSRVPSRYAIITILTLGLVAAWGLTKLIALSGEWSASRKIKTRNYALVGLSFFLLAFELFPAPYQMSDYKVAQFYRNLASDPGNYAIFSVPVIAYDTTYMEAQIEHGKPIIGGFLARPPLYPAFNGVPVFEQFRNAETAPKPDILPYEPLSLDVFRYWNVRYLVVHEDRVQGQNQLDKLLSLAYKLFPSGPVYKGESLQVFEVPPASAESAAQVFFYNPELNTWHDAESDGKNGSYRWAKEREAKLEFYSGQPRKLEMEFPVWSFHEPHSLEVYLNGVKLPDASREIGTTPQNLRLSLDLKQGRNELTFKIGGNINHPADFAPSSDTRPLTIAIGQIKFL
jgi:hypothetical protein